MAGPAGPKSLPAHDRIRQDQMAAAAQDLDNRRQKQIANQVDVMNRLLAERGVPDPEAGAKQIAILTEQLADAQVQIRAVHDILKEPLGSVPAHAMDQIARIAQVTRFDE